MASRSNKALACAPVVEDPACLRHIHDFLGAGHYSFIAPVSKLWKQTYEATPSLETATFYKLRKPILCHSKTTLYSSVFTSISRVRLLEDLKLQTSLTLTAWLLAVAIGKSAAPDVLQYALGTKLLNYMDSKLCQSLLCEGAVFAGNLVKLQWLHTVKGYALNADVSERAASCGNIEILQWLATVCASKIVHTEQAMTAACANGHIQTVQYLMSRGSKYWDAQCCDVAARTGQLDLIKWMVINEPFSSTMNTRRYDGMMYSAAVFGSIDVLHWLRYEHHVQYNASLIQRAAANNQLAVIQYLRAEGCPWDTSACTAAAGYGSMYNTNAQSDRCETLQWLHENGCPWNIADVHEKAAQNGNISVLAYVIKQGFVPDIAELTQTLNIAGVCNNLAAAKWLRQQGAEWPSALKNQIQHNLLRPWWGDTLDWARTEGCTAEVSSDT
jgi:hypothetical protein